jgi:phage virion morphogenesis protein
MIDGKIELQNQAVKAAFARLRLAMGGQLIDPMREVGRTLKTSTQLRFRAQAGPDGVPWKPSKRVEQHGGQTGRLSGRLRNSITYVATSSSVEVGTNLPYAAPFHFGKTKPETVRSHQRKVSVVFGRRLASPATAQVRGFTRKPNQPARPVVGASVQDTADILAITGRYLFRSAGVMQ